MPLNDEVIDELRADIATARKRDLNFAFCMGKKPEDGLLVCHKTKNPNVLYKQAKKGGETNKIASGTLSVKGKLAMMTCFDDPPAAISRSAKLFFKAAGLSMKVLILNPEGQEIESDDLEEGDDTADDKNDQGNDNSAQLAAVKKELFDLASDIKSLSDLGVQKQLGTALQVATKALAERDIDKSASTLATVRNAFEKAQANDQTGTEQGNEDDGGWAKTAAKLEPKVLAALKANHPEASTIRTVWAFAQEMAAERTYKSAMQAAGRLAKMLQTVPSNEPSDAPPQNVVAFQRSRLLWIDTKRAMKSDLDKFQNTVKSNSSDDEDQSEITAAVEGLIKEFDAFDATLEDILDTITQTHEGPERTKLKKEASKAINQYLATLETPFFKIIDSNPFVSVNVAARAKQSLSVVKSTLS